MWNQKDAAEKITQACVGKSCGKYNGKARSVGTLGILPCEWNLPLCWRSGGSHFFFVVCSGMMTCTTMERKNEEIDCKPWQSNKSSSHRTFLLFSIRREYLKAVFLFSFFCFFCPFLVGKMKAMLFKNKRFWSSNFCTSPGPTSCYSQFLFLRWMRIYYKRSQNNIWTTNVNCNNKSKSTKELQSKAITIIQSTRLQSSQNPCQ